MSLTSLLPKVAVFAVAAVAGALVTSLAGALVADRTPVSAVTEAPTIQLEEPSASDGQGVIAVAFDLIPTATEPQPLISLTAEEIAAAAAALLGNAPIETVVDPTGFPRIPAITQFDGSPKGNQNCTLASGAMLARLGSGIVTTGGILRDLQDVRDGGTTLGDLRTALRRGYGVEFERGRLAVSSFRTLLTAGAGAVIQGVYGQVPEELRLQPTFIDPHAIYIDGFYPGDAARGVGPAYFVIDPLGRPAAGYRGDWWPAAVVERFATTFGGGRVNAMWAFPAGSPDPGLPIDVQPLGTGSGGSTATPEPGGTPDPAATTFPDPGTVDPGVPEPPPSIDGTATVGDLDLLPGVAVCAADPKPAGCPEGIRGVFDRIVGGDLTLAPAPTITVKWVASDRPGAAFVGYVIDPAMSSKVQFWKDGEDGVLLTSIGVRDGVVLPSGTVTVAALEVEAATTYHFQVVGTDATTTVTGDVGTFTTGAGVSSFTVALETVSRPTIGVVPPLEAFTPYRRLLEGRFAFPLRLAQEVPACTSIGLLGARRLCLDVPQVLPEITSCPTVRVDYALAGIGETGVKVRVLPRERLADELGGLVLDGVLEGVGPAGSGSVAVGCLTPGVEYAVVLDAIGDTSGILAAKFVTAP